MNHDDFIPAPEFLGEFTAAPKATAFIELVEKMQREGMPPDMLERLKPHLEKRMQAREAVAEMLKSAQVVHRPPSPKFDPTDPPREGSPVIPVQEIERVRNDVAKRLKSVATDLKLLNADSAMVKLLEEAVQEIEQLAKRVDVMKERFRDHRMGVIE